MAGDSENQLRYQIPSSTVGSKELVKSMVWLPIAPRSKHRSFEVVVSVFKGASSKKISGVTCVSGGCASRACTYWLHFLLEAK